MYVFTEKRVIEVQFVTDLQVQFVTDLRALLSFIDNQQLIWFLHTKKLSSAYRQKSLCLDEAPHVACNWDETQTNKKFYYFSVAIDSMAKCK